VESLAIFEEAGALADRLTVKHPGQRRPLAWEKGHTLQALASTYVLLGNYPAAIENYREARATYRHEPDPEEIGHAEVLTNMAQAYACSGNLISAELSLLEAVDIAQRTGNRLQLDKITAVATHWNLKAVVAVTGGSIAEAAAQAAAAGQYSTAYIRHCIATRSALESGNLPLAAEQATAARSLERHLGSQELHPPRLRSMEATILEQQGEGETAFCRPLIEGAHEWWQRLTAVGRGHEDFRAIADDLHDHFRRLSGSTLRLGRKDEALAAFEIGRALAWAADAGPQMLARALGENPFAADGSSVDVSCIEQLQKRLPVDAVAVSLAALPPNLVAFVVSPQGIDVASVPVGRTVAEAQSHEEEIRMLPKSLRDAIGLAAVPDAVLQLGQSLRTIIGNHKIHWFAPYSFFHLVPWRAVLRSAGFAWEQLAFSVHFGLLYVTDPLPAEEMRRSGCLALGHGRAIGWDFRQEAERFVARWGTGATLGPSCRPQDVQDALAREWPLFLSCHGAASNTLRLVLELEGGDAFVEDLLPPRARMSLLVLSACESGVYDMAWGDDPVGFAPLALRRGIRRCICTRWPIHASFADAFFPQLAEEIQGAATLEAAFVAALARTEAAFDHWRDLACVEVLAS
jgi:tetratricopeptide (TPR) repeat protein